MTLSSSGNNSSSGLAIQPAGENDSADAMAADSTSSSSSALTSNTAVDSVRQAAPAAAPALRDNDGGDDEANSAGCHLTQLRRAVARLLERVTADDDDVTAAAPAADGTGADGAAAAAAAAPGTCDTSGESVDRARHVCVQHLGAALERLSLLADSERWRRAQCAEARHRAAHSRQQTELAYRQLCERRRQLLLPPAPTTGRATAALLEQLQRLESVEHVLRAAKHQFLSQNVALQREKGAARRRDDLCSRVERYRQEETKLAGRVKKQTKDIFKLRAQMTALQDEAAAVRATLSRADEQLPALRARRQTARDDRVAAQARVQQCKATLRQLRETVRVQRAEAGLLLTPSLLRDFDQQLQQEQLITHQLEQLSEVQRELKASAGKDRANPRLKQS